MKTMIFLIIIMIFYEIISNGELSLFKSHFLAKQISIIRTKASMKRIKKWPSEEIFRIRLVPQKEEKKKLIDEVNSLIGGN